jgi:hypothetical protein
VELGLKIEVAVIELRSLGYRVELIAHWCQHLAAEHDDIFPPSMPFGRGDHGVRT